MIISNGRRYVIKYTSENFRIIVSNLQNDILCFDFLFGCKIVMKTGTTGVIVFDNKLIKPSSDFPIHMRYDIGYKTSWFSVYDAITSNTVAIFCDITKFSKLGLTFV